MAIKYFVKQSLNLASTIVINVYPRGKKDYQAKGTQASQGLSQLKSVLYFVAVKESQALPLVVLFSREIGHYGMGKQSSSIVDYYYQASAGLVEDHGYCY